MANKKKAPIKSLKGRPRGSFRVGVEVETICFNGWLADTMMQDEMIGHMTSRSIVSELRNHPSKMTRTLLRLLVRLAGRPAKELAMSNENVYSIIRMGRKRLGEEAEALIHDIKKKLMYYSRKVDYELLEDSRFSLCFDYSVPGPEVKFTEPLQLGAAKVALHDMFRKFDIYTDNSCSFHVHLSRFGETAKYSKVFQQAAMEYILVNMERVPMSVRLRWSKPCSKTYRRRLHFFRPELSREKFTFVNFHERFGTYEFRCFGNVDNAIDAQACLTLAVEAYRHAEAVQRGDRQLLVRRWNPQTIIAQVLTPSKPLRGYIPKAS